MRVVSIRQEPTYKECAAKYIHGKWGDETNYPLYEDSIFGCVRSSDPLPHWYLLENQNEIIGCAGLIDHDFIDRTDLSPWLCSLYLEEEMRGKSLSALLIEQAISDAAKEGFGKLYLCTELEGFYEKYGFRYIGDGKYPDGEPARTYELVL
jgi:GNAT superfamily N-acetyltransferase